MPYLMKDKEYMSISRSERVLKILASEPLGKFEVSEIKKKGDFDNSQQVSGALRSLKAQGYVERLDASYWTNNEHWFYVWRITEKGVERSKRS